MLPRFLATAAVAASLPLAAAWMLISSSVPWVWLRVVLVVFVVWVLFGVAVRSMFVRRPRGLPVTAPGRFRPIAGNLNDVPRGSRKADR